MGVEGAALATLIARIAEVIALLLVLNRMSMPFKPGSVNFFMCRGIWRKAFW